MVKNLMLLINAVLLTSCLFAPSESDELPIEFDTQYLNKQITIFASPQLNTFRPGESIGLTLFYNTNYQISFPANYNLKIFIRDSGAWKEIEEQPVIRYPNSDIILSPEDPKSYGRMVVFFPDINDTRKSYEIIVYVIGDMTTPEGIIKVAAYSTILLNP